MPRPSIWKMPFLPTSSSQWKSSTPPNGPLRIWRRCINCALSPSMNVLPTPSVIQLLYSVVVSSDGAAGFSAATFGFSAGLSAGFSWAPSGRKPIKHVPASKSRRLVPRLCHGLGVVFMGVSFWLQGSESHRGPDLRSMNRLMASGTPAASTAEKRRVIAPADEDPPRRGLLLEMALEAKGLIARNQHALIDRTVRLVAGSAAFAQS